jgi:hypothetical protein
VQALAVVMEEVEEDEMINDFIHRESIHQAVGYGGFSGDDKLQVDFDDEKDETNLMESAHRPAAKVKVSAGA